MPIYTPFALVFFGTKWRKSETFCSYIFLRMQQLRLMSYESNRVKSLLRFILWTWAKIRVKKRKLKNKNPRDSNISPSCRDASIGAIALNFGVRDHIADLITHAKFCWQTAQGFRSSDIPNFAILHRNSWSSLLPCCIVINIPAFCNLIVDYAPVQHNS